MSISAPPRSTSLAPGSHPGRLQNKVAIVTGGGMGLGEGIVRKFVHEGARVIIFDIDPVAGTRVASSLPLDKIHLFTGSVTNLNHWKEALKCAIDAFGKLDIVVNNAGVVHVAQVSGRHQNRPPLQDRETPC